MTDRGIWFKVTKNSPHIKQITRNYLKGRDLVGIESTMLGVALDTEDYILMRIDGSKIVDYGNDMSDISWLAIKHKADNAIPYEEALKRLGITTQDSEVKSD